MPSLTRHFLIAALSCVLAAAVGSGFAAAKPHGPVTHQPGAARAGKPAPKPPPVYAVGAATSRDPATGRIERSHAARQDFRQARPCPSTGRRSGACPGYQIDHAMPLKCGGADAPPNMQWLTVQSHARKTAREASSCRRHRAPR